MPEFSPKLAADIQQGGGRLYKGRRLFQPAPWVCPSCGAQNSGTVEQGCSNGECMTRQERPVKATGSPTGRLRQSEPESQRLPSLPLTAQLRTQRLNPGGITPADLATVEDRIVQRLTDAMDDRLLRMAQGGLSPAAQATIAEALGVLVLLAEEDQIQLGSNLLSLDDIRSLALTFTTDQQELYADPDPTPRTPQRPADDPNGRTDDAGAAPGGLPDWLSRPAGGPDTDEPDADPDVNPSAH